MKQTPNTFQCFSEIKDYRRMGDNTLHNFTDILVIALCGIISGTDDWVSIQGNCTIVSTLNSSIISTNTEMMRITLVLEVSNRTYGTKEMRLLFDSSCYKHIRRMRS